MEMKDLLKRSAVDQDEALKQAYAHFEILISELQKRELPDDILHSVNRHIVELNSFSGPDKALVKELKNRQSHILRLLEKKLQLVVKNHYRHMWLAMGMTAIGMPVGMVIGALSGQMSLLVTGLPLGLILGMVIGTNLDQKALTRGKQLNVEYR